MRKPVYILSAAAISPQLSFERDGFLDPALQVSDGKLFVTDPDYRQYINPVAIRRMSRLMKMGISSGMRALELAGIQCPDAIITGTGLGSMTDMEHFLKDMIRLNEEALNPTFFIQSTYNSVNGWLAMQSKSTGYNQTYVNRGLSLELSLLDAQMFLNEHEERKTVLAGCFDELTPEYYIVKSKCGYWKLDPPDSLELLAQSDTPGTIAGEGTAFFTLSNKQEGSACTLKGMKMLDESAPDAVIAGLRSLLKEQEMNIEDIDLVILGQNGDVRAQPLYKAFVQEIQEQTGIAVFKHLCGEYPTASGFALWLAARIFKNLEVPVATVYRKGKSGEIRNILILNHYILGSASLMLLSR